MSIQPFGRIKTSTMPEGTEFIGFRQGEKKPARTNAEVNRRDENGNIIYKTDAAGDDILDDNGNKVPETDPVDLTGVSIKLTAEYYIARSLTVNAKGEPTFSGEALNPDVPLRQLTDPEPVDVTEGEYEFTLENDFYPQDIDVPLNANRNVPFVACLLYTSDAADE